jgi:hypothetical protein
VKVDEREWLTCGDPKPMLMLLRGQASERKLRLFLAACCRRIWDFLSDESCRHAVLVAEQLADGKAGTDGAHLYLRGEGHLYCIGKD